MYQQKGLVFRVAVRETESWILADRNSFCKYFNIPKQKMVKDPDKLSDPKQFLINIVRQYDKNKERRESVVPHRKSGAIVGPDYNSTLIHYIEHYWDVRKARQASDSLDRSVKAVEKAYSGK